MISLFSNIDTCILYIYRPYINQLLKYFMFACIQYNNIRYRKLDRNSKDQLIMLYVFDIILPTNFHYYNL